MDLNPPAAPDNGLRQLSLGPDIVSRRIEVADTARRRMKGLLGLDGLEADQGLFITPCPSIHMFFMRFAIDVVFVTKDLRVVRVFPEVKPWRMARGGRKAKAVFELPVGTIERFTIRPGDQLELVLPEREIDS